MKKLFAGFIIALLSCSVMAQHGYRPSHRQHHNHHNHYRNHSWVAPLVIGGAVGYALTRPPVVIEQPVIINTQPIHGIDDVVYINGRYYRKDVVMINGIWQEVLVPQ